MNAVGRRPRTASRSRSRWAPTASASRAWSARIIEASHDDAGIVWPDAVAPFKVGDRQPEARRRRGRRRLREALRRARRPRASTCCTTTATCGRARKFADMDLIGIPWQVIVGPRGARRRQGRAQEPQDRRARGAAARTGPRAVRLTRAWPSMSLAVERLIAFRYLRARRERGLHLGHRRLLADRHRARRRHADRRHVGDERLPRRDAARRCRASAASSASSPTAAGSTPRPIS